MEEQLKKIVYSHNTIEFVTVAVQYCAFLENSEELQKDEMIDKLTKILPLLYLKVSMIPDTEMVNDEEPEMVVTEDVYAYRTSKLFEVFNEDDTYLEVFMEDMKYSETPISASISESLVDIYQDLKNFTAVYEYGVTENMNDALYVCIENFKTYWGQKLVNVMRALHNLKYADRYTSDEDEDPELTNTDDLW